MTLTDIVRKLFGRHSHQEEPVHQEPSTHDAPEPSEVYFGPKTPARFFVFLVPDKIFEDSSYKLDRLGYRKVKPDWGDYFDSCVEDIGRAVEAVFGAYHLTREDEQETVTLTHKTPLHREDSTLTFNTRIRYIFTTERHTITYEIYGRDIVRYTPRPTYGGIFIRQGIDLADEFFLDIIGTLTVQSSTLGREELQDFMSRVLNTHTLSNLKEYTPSQQISEKPLLSASDVARLSSIGITPQTVARYTISTPFSCPRGYYTRAETGLAH